MVDTSMLSMVYITYNWGCTLYECFDRVHHATEHLRASQVTAWNWGVAWAAHGRGRCQPRTPF